jgi:hypothetical protein
MTSPSHPSEPVHDTASPTRAPDLSFVMGLAQLWADQFQHTTTLAVAAVGGLIILLQTGVVVMHRRWWASMALFVLSAVIGFAGQNAVVDDATEGRLPGRKARVMRLLAALALGGGGGAAFRLFTA